jgi:hypothetical protein
MPAASARAIGWRRVRHVGVLSLVVAIVVWFPSLDVGRARQESRNDAARIQVVHGVSAAGPLDVYVDGALALIGIVFGESSGEIGFSRGEHELAVVPSGGTPEDAIAAGAIALEGGTRFYVTLLGAPESASVGLFRVDGRPLDAGRARFRIINGASDSGEIIPVFSGGDALSDPLAFGDASEYAAIDPGTYDLDMLDGATGTVLLSVPQVEFGEGTTTDVILIGQLTDASLQALVETLGVSVERAAGRTARILAGTCAEPGDVVAELGVIQEGQGETVGSGAVAPVAQVYGLAGVSFAILTGAPHVIAVDEGDDVAGDIVACGEIGGRLTDTGSLAMTLGLPRSGRTAGVAVLAPGLDDPETTGVSVFLAAGVRAAAAGTPEAATE